MSASALLTEVTLAGITLAATDHGTLKYSGDPSVLERLLPEIRAHKPELMALLVANDTAPPPIRYASPEALADDRRACAQCFELAHDGKCKAAKRGELRGLAPWYAPDPVALHRCLGYEPLASDPDQRTGRGRWPGLARRLLRDGKA